MLGMRVRIDSGRPRANFPRKISKENVRNNRCFSEETKRIGKLKEICKRKKRKGKGKLDTLIISFRFMLDFKRLHPLPPKKTWCLISKVKMLTCS